MASSLPRSGLRTVSDRPRQAVPIVPAIPRKLERKTQQNPKLAPTDGARGRSSPLDPHSPPFIPKNSKNLSEPGSSASSPVAKTESSEDPYSSSSPRQDLSKTNGSAKELSYHDRGHYVPYYAQPTPPTEFEKSTASIYSGYGYGYNFAFYPPPGTSYDATSPTRSSYEGYTMGGGPHTIQTQEDPTPYFRDSVTTNGHHSTSDPAFPPYSYGFGQSLPQSQYNQSFPQFGNQPPLTPSATPSNSGSHQPNVYIGSENGNSQLVEDYQTEAPELPGSARPNPKFKAWCESIIKILLDHPESTNLHSQLASHLSENFDVSAFADCEMNVSHSKARFEEAVINVHSLMIAQNPIFRESLLSADNNAYGKKQIKLQVIDQYTSPSSIRTALKVYYGESPTHFTGFPVCHPESEPIISVQWMENALSFAAAGHLLGMVGVAHRGEQIASTILGWDNVERALSFAMDASISRAWGSHNSLDFPSNASELLLSCLYFIITSISGSFSLDLGAPPLVSIDRLPAVTEPHPSSKRSRLNNIQFGDLPIGTSQPVNKQDNLISSILFSIPFAQLKFILDRISLDTNREITKAVVEQREHRRLRAVRCQSSTSHLASDENTVLIWEERVFERSGESSTRLGVAKS